MRHEPRAVTLSDNSSGERGLAPDGGCYAGRLAGPRPLLRRSGTDNAANSGGCLRERVFETNGVAPRTREPGRDT
jgi:hypothetical protein